MFQGYLVALSIKIWQFFISNEWNKWTFDYINIPSFQSSAYSVNSVIMKLLMGDLLLLPSNVENTEADGMIPKKNKWRNKKLTFFESKQ